MYLKYNYNLKKQPYELMKLFINKFNDGAFFFTKKSKMVINKF